MVINSPVITSCLIKLDQLKAHAKCQPTLVATSFMLCLLSMKYSGLLYFKPTVGWNPTAAQLQKFSKGMFRTSTSSRRTGPPVDVPVAAHSPSFTLPL